MLIKAAVEGTNGNLDTDVLRAELEKANFDSIRGDFKFGNNHFPIQDFYAREVVVDADGNWTTSATGIALEDHQDVYAAECSLG